MLDPADLRTPIVIDVGTGSTKLGFGGNLDASYNFPTATQAAPAGDSHALQSILLTPSVAPPAGSCAVQPVQRGVVADWQEYEKLMFDCFLNKLQVEPEQHAVLISEPPLAAPRARECAAEVLFEACRVPALHVALQPLLALYGTQARNGLDLSGETGTVDLDNVAAAISVSDADLTGVVVDVGAGAAHVVPIISGYVQEAAVRGVPVCGADVTAYLEQAMRTSGQPLPARGLWALCEHIKCECTYVCKNVRQELEKLKQDPASITLDVSASAGSRAKHTDSTSKVQIGAERFLAPEIFFDPSIAQINGPPLQQLVDEAIQACSIDSRRKLYANICLSVRGRHCGLHGGSSMFKNFGRKLRMEVQRRVDARLGAASKGVPVTVTRHRSRDVSVWTGGSLLAVSPDFSKSWLTRAAYEEHGPSITWREDLLPTYTVDAG